MPNIDQSGDKGYADLNAPEALAGYTPLADFFGLYPNQRKFVPILTTNTAAFFQNYYPATGTSPIGPDDDEGTD